ncbi:MAG: hypothetical protein F7C81_00495 [Desulfurococcales archaeon]|nr:hypothetical protein [Desulfurococcales archaeon]
MSGGETIILYECINDEAIARLIAKTKGGRTIPRHAGGKTRVLEKAYKLASMGKASPDQIIALIDHDPEARWPKSHSYIRTKMEKIDEHTYVFREKHGDTYLTILIFSPRLEEWLLAVCKTLKKRVDPSALHRNPKLFKEILDRCGDEVQSILRRALTGKHYHTA